MTDEREKVGDGREEVKVMDEGEKVKAWEMGGRRLK